MTKLVSRSNLYNKYEYTKKLPLIVKTSVHGGSN